MEVTIINEQNILPIDENKIINIVMQVITLEGQKADEVAINFVSTEEISRLHLEFFDDPTTTDCISFPMDDEYVTNYRVLGEIFVCPETALKYSLEHQVNALEEMVLYVIHGLLHLMGYDDIQTNDRKKMRLAEKKHLVNLKELGLL